MFGLTRKDLVGAASVLALAASSQGCSLLFVPRPAPIREDPGASCGAYLWPGLDMTAALLGAGATIHALYVPNEMTPDGQSVKTGDRITAAAGVGALTAGFVVSGLIGINWIERCRAWRGTQSVPPPEPTLRVNKVRRSPGPDQTAFPGPALPIDTED